MVLFFNKQAQSSDTIVRPPALAGSWYPKQADALSKQITDLLTQIPSTTAQQQTPPVRAVLIPHAGYSYSGRTAMTALKMLTGASFKRVVIIAPAHRVGFTGVALPEASHFRTPLGDIPLDTTAMTSLRETENPLIRTIPGAHDQEHSIEIELPLLQTILANGWQLLPLLVGQMDYPSYSKIAETLRPFLDEQTLLVISGDFTHLGSHFDFQPFALDANIAENLQQLDMGAVDHIIARNPKGFLDYREKTGITACAFGPVMVLLNLITDQVEPRLIQYHTSGSDNGDFSHSVSYVSMTFHASKPLAALQKDPPPLGNEEMKQLHALAVATIRKAVQHDETITPANVNDIKRHFQNKAGAFVTLKRSGTLRGCIGQLMPVAPLYQAVADNAVNAALHDNRFQPVTPDELNDMEVTISVLSPMRPIPSWEAFEVGKQGIVLSKNGRRAVFLPEVAGEQGWNREQTLTELSQKAGLPKDAWKSGASFEVFTSQVYSAPIPSPAKPSHP
ncbi:MAG: AmmeMemoRadiSam system protein B [Magnetococcales bacterium]|nr:AmmeMemoRadiSam system protein B [Magnetococcales bacterium]